MFSVGQELYLESELKRAKLLNLPVLVKYEDGEIADYGGPIEELNRDRYKRMPDKVHST